MREMERIMPEMRIRVIPKFARISLEPRRAYPNFSSPISSYSMGIFKKSAIFFPISRSFKYSPRETLRISLFTTLISLEYETCQRAMKTKYCVLLTRIHMEVSILLAKTKIIICQTASVAPTAFATCCIKIRSSYSSSVI